MPLQGIFEEHAALSFHFKQERAAQKRAEIRGKKKAERGGRGTRPTGAPDPSSRKMTQGEVKSRYGRAPAKPVPINTQTAEEYMAELFENGFS